METGVVVRFDDDRGYGFIEPDSGGEDVFIHASGLDEELKARLQAGQRVEYDAVNGHRGKKAFEVQLIDETEGEDEPERGPAAGDTPFTEGGRLSHSELRHLLTETFLGEVPDLSGAQIVKLREVVGDLAVKRGWVR